LVETANFVVLPSLGSLVEGWLLLIPRRHFICMGALPSELLAEMEQLKAKVGAHLRERFGSVCAFEHGPGETNRKVGCGVDHAHLHMVPIALGLKTAVSPFLPSGASWATSGWDSCREAYEAGLDYLYLEQPLGSGSISVHREFGSQVFRRAIAAHCGVPEQFNWREYPRTEVVAATIQHLERAMTSGGAGHPAELVANR
jgi:diadenosine tetraphosphate (Ap4A) HIT family hydrolase